MDPPGDDNRLNIIVAAIFQLFGFYITIRNILSAQMRGVMRIAVQRSGSMHLQCYCQPNNEAPRCGTHCVNYTNWIECSSVCVRCLNCKIRNGYFAAVNHRCAGRNERGLFCVDGIRRGLPVIEFTGLVRENLGNEQSRLILPLPHTNLVIDSTLYSNGSRFIRTNWDNFNTALEIWVVDDQFRAAFFALVDINAGDEITFNGNCYHKCIGGPTMGCDPTMQYSNQRHLTLRNPSLVLETGVQVLVPRPFRQARNGQTPPPSYTGENSVELRRHQRNEAFRRNRQYRASSPCDGVNNPPRSFSVSTISNVGELPARPLLASITESEGGNVTSGSSVNTMHITDVLLGDSGSIPANRPIGSIDIPLIELSGDTITESRREPVQDTAQNRLMDAPQFQQEGVSGAVEVPQPNDQHPNAINIAVIEVNDGTAPASNMDGNRPQRPINISIINASGGGNSSFSEESSSNVILESSGTTPPSPDSSSQSDQSHITMVDLDSTVASVNDPPNLTVVPGRTPMQQSEPIPPTTALAHDGTQMLPVRPCNQGRTQIFLNGQLLQTGQANPGPSQPIQTQPHHVSHSSSPGSFELGASIQIEEDHGTQHHAVMPFIPSQERSPRNFQIRSVPNSPVALLPNYTRPWNDIPQAIENAPQVPPRRNFVPEIRSPGSLRTGSLPTSPVSYPPNPNRPVSAGPLTTFPEGIMPLQPPCGRNFIPQERSPGSIQVRSLPTSPVPYPRDPTRPRSAGPTFASPPTVRRFVLTDMHEVNIVVNADGNAVVNSVVQDADERVGLTNATADFLGNAAADLLEEQDFNTEEETPAFDTECETEDQEDVCQDVCLDEDQDEYNESEDCGPVDPRIRSRRGARRQFEPTSDSEMSPSCDEEVDTQDQMEEGETDDVTTSDAAQPCDRPVPISRQAVENAIRFATTNHTVKPPGGEGATHECQYCDLLFHSAHDRDLHQLICPRGPRPLLTVSCRNPNCGSQLQDPKCLRQHEQKCKLGGMKYGGIVHPDYLPVGLRKQGKPVGDKKHECKYKCGKKFTDNTQLSSHERHLCKSNPNVDPFECGRCNRRFESNYKRGKHLPCEARLDRETEEATSTESLPAVAGPSSRPYPVPGPSTRDTLTGVRRTRQGNGQPPPSSIGRRTRQGTRSRPTRRQRESDDEETETQDERDCQRQDSKRGRRRRDRN